MIPELGQTKNTSYAEFKKMQSNEIEEFTKKNCFWAFSKEQYEKALKERNLTEETLQEQYASFVGGGVILKTAVPEWAKLCKNQDKALHDRMESDYEFAKEAFNYELNNYECFISYRFEEAFRALGYSTVQINSSPHLLKAFNEAKKIYWDWAIENC